MQENASKCKQIQANASKCKQMQVDASEYKQMLANANKCKQSVWEHLETIQNEKKSMSRPAHPAFFNLKAY